MFQPFDSFLISGLPNISLQIKSLEHRIAQLRRRENDVRDSSSNKTKDMEEKNLRFERVARSLTKEKAQLNDKVLEVSQCFHIGSCVLNSESQYSKHTLFPHVPAPQ